MQPSAASLLNLGLAFSRVYNNVAAGHAYGAALGFDHGSEAWTSAVFRESEALQGVCAGWASLERRVGTLQSVVSAQLAGGALPLAPFLAMSLPFSPEEVGRITEAHARHSVALARLEREEAGGAFPFPTAFGPPIVPAGAGRRLRVVYVGAHFDPDRLMNGFLKGVWALHPRQTLEVHCVGWGDSDDSHGASVRGGKDDSRPWIASQVEHYHDMKGLSDLEIAIRINALLADVAVEIVGWYPEQRSGIVAHRPSRVQALYRFIGPGGGRGDDFFVTDSISFPPETLHATTGERRGDRLVYLQPLYLACSHATSFPHPANVEPGCQDRAGPRTALAQRLGVAGEDRPLLGALNKFYKFTPGLFDAYCHVLKTHPSALLVLVQYRHYREGIATLRREAALRGVSPARVVSVPEGSHAEFMQVGAGSDIFLDTTYPLSNGHTTVADMIWAGVPVVTVPGPSQPSRVASAIALASGRGAWIARTLSDLPAVASAALKRTSQSDLLTRQSDLLTRQSELTENGSKCPGFNRDPFDPAFFATRWVRALRLMAEAPEAHVVVPQDRTRLSS